MQDVLVTGGSGFIGTHLCNYLKDFGNTTIFDIKNNPSENLLNQKALDPAVSGKTKIFHLAALTSVQESLNKPELCFRTNVEGTFNVLESCRKNDVPEILFTSSAAVYGNPLYCPIDEKHPTNPISPYGQSKLLGESMFKFYSDVYGIKSVILRLFNVYGPGSGRNVVDIIKKCKSDGSKFNMNGDGKQTRDFIHVTDVVKACVHAKPGLYNIGSGNEYSILSICQKAGTPFTHVKQLNNEIRRSVAFIKKAESSFNFKPSIDVYEVI
jgi:UDP-glucose 4-epimerase